MLAGCCGNGYVKCFIRADEKGMRNRIPPLTALRAFEAAVRLNSFAKAAEDLFVTPAAISQQIRQLEEYLGVRLFERTNKGIRTTEACEQYYPMISAAFEMLRKASQKLSTFHVRNQMVISLLPSLASQWLGASLFQWCGNNPEVQIAILATHSEPDFENGEAHLRIRYGQPRQREILSEELLVDRVVPVCSPALLERTGAIQRPEQILDLPLIHIDWGEDNDSLPSWSDWFQAAGVPNVDCRRGPVFNLSSLAIQAALAGKGFVLGQNLMVRDELKAGRLVPVSDIDLPLRDSYFLAYPESTLNHPHFDTFRSWLRAQVREGLTSEASH